MGFVAAFLCMPSSQKGENLSGLRLWISDNVSALFLYVVLNTWTEGVSSPENDP